MGFIYIYFFEVQINFFQWVGNQVVSFYFDLIFQFVVGLIWFYMNNFIDYGGVGYGNGCWFYFIFKCQMNFMQCYVYGVEVGDFLFFECIFNNWFVGKCGQCVVVFSVFQYNCFDVMGVNVEFDNGGLFFFEQ